ncbi:hypothetical protein CHUUTOTORO_01800 [Serratia phage vB_SmaM-ChuuTotoro]|nr:hypothetical protein CHUUTOTORO_01800 [Serratia phage vB_SmaM-ChuuTotoro]
MNCLMSVALAVLVSLLAMPAAYTLASLEIISQAAAGDVAAFSVVFLFVAIPLSCVALILDATLPKLWTRFL